MVKMLRPRLAETKPRIKPATVSATMRTRGSTWMAIRAQALARDCGLCQTCKAAGRLRLACQVDHIRELADGGTDALGNLQSLCAPCHDAKTRAAKAARAGQGRGD